MYLLSYRGPASAGGISSALDALWSHPQSGTLGWWHMADGGLVYSSSVQRPGLLHGLPAELIAGHYRFCNEFIWPLVHGFEEEIVFDPISCRSYMQLQVELVEGLSRHIDRDDVFIHDYQFGLLPQHTKSSTFFWHIPWPKSVSSLWKPFLSNLAVNISACQKIGFHTQGYADNFLGFLDERLARQTARKISVAPLPIDHELWEARAVEAGGELPSQLAARVKRPYILSVDRADYAKGILERLDAIDRLFEDHPEFLGKYVFVQLCQRTRPGIGAFDKYWQRCQIRHERLNSRWTQGNWTPSVWVEDVFDGKDLAHLYKHADALLISSLADGLNLTAKEYIACQKSRAGALILSDRAGVWQQLQTGAFGFDPRNSISAAATIAQAVVASESERRHRMQCMQNVIYRESLLEWAEMFAVKRHASVG